MGSCHVVMLHWSRRPGSWGYRAHRRCLAKSFVLVPAITWRRLQQFFHLSHGSFLCFQCFDSVAIKDVDWQTRYGYLLCWGLQENEWHEFGHLLHENTTSRHCFAMKQEGDFRPQTYYQRQFSLVDHVNSDPGSGLVAVVFTSNCCQYGSYCCCASCEM